MHAQARPHRCRALPHLARQGAERDARTATRVAASARAAPRGSSWQRLRTGRCAASLKAAHWLPRRRFTTEAFQISTVIILAPRRSADRAPALIGAAAAQDACLSCEAANCGAGACGDYVGCSLCPPGFGSSAVRAPFVCDVACPAGCADCDRPAERGGRACARCQQARINVPAAPARINAASTEAPRRARAVTLSSLSLGAWRPATHPLRCSAGL